MAPAHCITCSFVPPSASARVDSSASLGHFGSSLCSICLSSQLQFTVSAHGSRSQSHVLASSLSTTCTHLSLNTWLIIISTWLQFRFRLIIAPTALPLSHQQLLCVYTQHHGLSRAFRVIIVFSLFSFAFRYISSLLRFTASVHSFRSQFQVIASILSNVCARSDSVCIFGQQPTRRPHQLLCTFSSACYHLVPRLYDFTCFRLRFCSFKPGFYTFCFSTWPQARS